MTLAVILLNLSFVIPTQSQAPPPASPQSAPAPKPSDTQTTPDQAPHPSQPTPSQAAPEAKSTESQPAQSQPNSSPENPPPNQPSAPQTSAPSQKPAPGNPPLRSHHKKKALPLPNCIPAPATAATPTAADSKSQDKTSGDPASSETAPTPTKAPAPTICPPQKVVVPHGGTSEPDIQLAGGASGSPEREKATQMLQSAEENLKKIEGRQLSSSQRDMVTQVRQFVNQSKSATAAGDLERPYPRMEGPTALGRTGKPGQIAD